MKTCDWLLQQHWNEYVARAPCSHPFSNLPRVNKRFFNLWHMDAVPALPEADGNLLGEFYTNERENFAGVKAILVEILQHVGLWAATLPMAIVVLGMCKREFPGRGISLESLGVSRTQMPLNAMARPGREPNDVTRLVFNMQDAIRIMTSWMWDERMVECEDLFEILKNVKLALEDLVFHLNMGALRDGVELHMAPLLPQR